MTTIREYILDEAKKCVLKDRNLDYDEPEKNFEQIAALWNAYLVDKLKAPIEPHDTAIMALLIKVARIRTSPHKADHWIDAAGYSAAGAECVVKREGTVVDYVDAETGEEFRLVTIDWKDFSDYTER